MILGSILPVCLNIHFKCCTNILYQIINLQVNSQFYASAFNNIRRLFAHTQTRMNTHYRTLQMVSTLVVVDRRGLSCLTQVQVDTVRKSCRLTVISWLSVHKVFFTLKDPSKKNIHTISIRYSLHMARWCWKCTQLFKPWRAGCRDCQATVSSCRSPLWGSSESAARR